VFHLLQIKWCQWWWWYRWQLWFKVFMVLGSSSNTRSNAFAARSAWLVAEVASTAQWFQLNAAASDLRAIAALPIESTFTSGPVTAGGGTGTAPWWHSRWVLIQRLDNTTHSNIRIRIIRFNTAAIFHYNGQGLPSLYQVSATCYQWQISEVEKFC